MASDLEAVSMTAGIGQQQWLCTFFRLSDRTLINRVRNFVTWQKLAEFQAEAWLLVAVWIWAISWHGGPVQTAGKIRGRAAHKKQGTHLETTCEIHHIYEDLNKSSSARPGRSQQLEIPPSLNSKQAACFSSSAGFSSNTGFSSNAGFSPGAGISTPARILSSAWLLANARISQSACFFSKSKDFSIRLIFSKSRDFSIRLIFSSCKYLYIFSVFYFFCILCKACANI
jgi:hypothetical protein